MLYCRPCYDDTLAIRTGAAAEKSTSKASAFVRLSLGSMQWRKETPITAQRLLVNIYEARPRVSCFATAKLSHVHFSYSNERMLKTQLTYIMYSWLSDLRQLLYSYCSLKNVPMYFALFNYAILC